MARALRKVVGLGLLAGLAYAAWRWWDTQRESAGTDWEPQPFPYPPTPKTQDDAATAPGGSPADDVTEEVSPDV
jgi:hypothetical protein